MSTLTKIFIVLQLVFSITLSVFVFLTLGGQQKYKDQVESALQSKIAAEASLGLANSQVAQLQSQYADLMNQKTSDANRLNDELTRRTTEINTRQVQIDKLDAEKLEILANIQRLTNTVSALQSTLTRRDQELDSVRPENQKLIAQNAELNRKNNEQAQQLDLAEKTIRTLQETLAQRPAAPAQGTAPAQGEAVATLSGVPTQAQINGTVTKVQSANGKIYATLSLGSRDGIAANTRLVVYRGSNYVGDAVVVRVTPDQSVAQITVSKDGVQANDRVISGGGF